MTPFVVRAASAACAIGLLSSGAAGRATVRGAPRPTAAANRSEVQPRTDSPPPRKPLDPGRLNDIISASGYTALRNHDLSLVAGGRTASGREVVMISMDGGEPTLRLPELLDEVGFFERLAQERLTVGYEFGRRGERRHLTLTTLPNNKARSYYLFATALTDLALIVPELGTLPNPRTPALTANATLRPTPTVTLLKDRLGPVEPSGAGLRVAGWRFDVATEACQASVFVAGGETQADRVLGQEALCNSFGLAMAAAQDGLSYEDYEVLVGDRGVIAGYERLDAALIVLRPSQYRDLTG